MINTTRAGPREVAALQTWLRAPAQQWVEQAVASDGPLYSTALCLLLLSPQVNQFIVSSMDPTGTLFVTMHHCANYWSLANFSFPACHSHFAMQLNAIECSSGNSCNLLLSRNRIQLPICDTELNPIHTTHSLYLLEYSIPTSPDVLVPDKSLFRTS